MVFVPLLKPMRLEALSERLFMDLLKNFYLTDMLHLVSSDLLIPTVVILLALIVYSIYSIGTVVVEMAVERRRYHAVIPELIARLDAVEPEDLIGVIDDSGLLRAQKDDLDELAAYLYLPEDARTEVAKRLLANENKSYQKAIGRTDIATKVAPMLGLMGTLIPLGPGIVALGQGDTATLSSSLLVAFDTTVAGLAAAIVCYIISKVRRRWYSDYVVSMEAVMNTLLEKAQTLHARGYAFEEAIYSYDKSGRKAHKKQAERRSDGRAENGLKDESSAQESLRRSSGERGDAL